MNVTVRGTTVDVDWPSAADASPASYDRMINEVERLVLVETLETAAPVTVRWTEHREVGVLGASTVYAVAVAQSWTSRRRRQPLDRNSQKAAVLAQCPEVAVAITQVRLAMERGVGTRPSRWPACTWHLRAWCCRCAATLVAANGPG